MTDPQKKEAQVRPFGAVLQDLDRGRTHTELSAKLHELVAAVQDTGKKGTVTLQLTVKPIKPGQTDTLEVTAAVTTAPPKRDDPATVFFTTKDGNLTREDPDQMKLPLRVVETREETTA